MANNTEATALSSNSNNSSISIRCNKGTDSNMEVDRILNIKCRIIYSISNICR